MKKEQQQLGWRNTCTPTNVSLVCSPVVLTLNKEETLSEQDLKTLPNNLEVNQQQHIVVQKIFGIVCALTEKFSVSNFFIIIRKYFLVGGIYGL